MSRSLSTDAELPPPPLNDAEIVIQDQDVQFLEQDSTVNEGNRAEVEKVKERGSGEPVQTESNRRVKSKKSVAVPSH